MKRFRFFVALLLVGALGNECRAENLCEWDSSSYPKKGCMAGAILVKGKLTLDTGWTPALSGKAYAWQDGLSAVEVTVFCDGSTLSETEIPDLVSGGTYYVTIEIEVFNGCMTELLRTEFRTQVPN